MSTKAAAKKTAKSRETSPSESTRHWKQRIVGTGEKPARWFKANPSNWRVHPLKQQDALCSGLDSVGWVQNVIVNKRTSKEWPESERGVETLIDGHMRVGRAIQVSEDEPVPFVYVDLNPKEEAVVMAMLDPIGAMATVDAASLKSLLELAAGVNAQTDELLNLLHSVALPPSEKKPKPAKPPRDLVCVFRFATDEEFIKAIAKFGLEDSGQTIVVEIKDGLIGDGATLV